MGILARIQRLEVLVAAHADRLANHGDRLAVLEAVESVETDGLDLETWLDDNDGTEDPDP